MEGLLLRRTPEPVGNDKRRSRQRLAAAMLVISSPHPRSLAPHPCQAAAATGLILMPSAFITPTSVDRRGSPLGESAL
jgi:hypothetical protein